MNRMRGKMRKSEIYRPYRRAVRYMYAFLDHAVCRRTLSSLFRFVSTATPRFGAEVGRLILLLPIAVSWRCVMSFPFYFEACDTELQMLL